MRHTARVGGGGAQAARLWSRLESGNRFTDVLLSIATGPLTPEDEEFLGLVRTHAYAVLDVRRRRGCPHWWHDGHTHVRVCVCVCVCVCVVCVWGGGGR